MLPETGWGLVPVRQAVGLSVLLARLVVLAVVTVATPVPLQEWMQALVWVLVA